MLSTVKIKTQWYKLIFLLVVVIIFLKLCTRRTVAITHPHFEVLGPLNLTEPHGPTELMMRTDYTNLIDLSNFKFSINSNVCNKTKDPLLIAIVSTKPDHFQNREVIRNTWGSSSETVKTVFLVGDTKDPEIDIRISKESETHNDIVKGNFVDAYKNMTYKHVMGLKWVTYHCYTARYILKMDDDVYVNMESMLKFLTTMSPWGAKNLILCQTFENVRVMRTYRSKWRVTPEEYPEKYYPTYCAGYAILYSPDVVRQLYLEAQKSRYFWIDDAHITGVLAKQIGVTPTDMGTLRLTTHNQMIKSMFGIELSPFYIFGPPDTSPDAMLYLWRATVKKISVT